MKQRLVIQKLVDEQGKSTYQILKFVGETPDGIALETSDAGDALAFLAGFCGTANDGKGCLVDVGDWQWQHNL